jgi:hypothetical protein
MKEILKKIFVPGYILGKTSWDKEVEVLYTLVLTCYILFRIGLGINQANKGDKCTINSFADVMITPMYALGCNLGKDRFTIKLN